MYNVKKLVKKEKCGNKFKVHIIYFIRQHYTQRFSHMQQQLFFFNVDQEKYMHDMKISFFLI